LNSESDLLRDYALTDKRQFLEREAADSWMPQATNLYLQPGTSSSSMSSCPRWSSGTIRAWHYRRLADGENRASESGGVYLSNLEAIRRRLDVQVSARVLSAENADALYAASPFHQQHDSRVGKFWMTSHPLAQTIAAWSFCWETGAAKASISGLETRS